MKILDKRILALLAVTGAGFSLFFSSVAFQYELENENQQFNHRAKTVFKEIQLKLDTLKNIDDDIASLFYALDDIDEAEFKLFTHSTIHRTPFINTIFYMPHIESRDKETISRQLQGRGYTGFRFRNFPDKQYEPSPFSDDLFPVKFINPFNVQNSKWIGLDILTFSQGQSAVIRAIEFAKTLILSPDNEKENNLYAFRALHYGRGMPVKRSLNIDGVFGILGYKINVNRLASDMASSSSEKLLIFLDDTKILGNRLAITNSLPGKYFEENISLAFGDQILRISLQKNIDYFQLNMATPVFVLIIGLLLTMLMSYIAWSNIEHRLFLLKQNATIEHEVAQKTAQLEQQSEKLKAAYKEQKFIINELESFSYSISHDLRTPLRAIDGYSHILLDDYSETLDDTALDYLHRVRNNAQHMGNLIDVLLDLSRVSRQPIKPETISLDEHARKILNELGEHDTTQKNYDIIVGEKITATGDSHLLYTVLENLLSNAWKYSSKSDNPKIEFNMTRDDGKTVYFVKDNGIGFNMDYADKLFYPFQRLHGADFLGDGIGLATVKRIIDRHHGHIWADSEPNKGSTFFFTLNDD